MFVRISMEDVFLMWLHRRVQYNYCFPPAPFFKGLISGQPHRPPRRKQVLSVAELLTPYSYLIG